MATFDPQWTGVFEDYSRAFVRRNGWRVRYTLTDDEALQTCAEVFSRCRARYCRPRRVLRGVDNPAWFMALFKRALEREFNSASNKCTEMRAADAAFAAEQVRELSEGQDYNLGLTMTLLSSASEELREVLTVVARAPGELLDILLVESDDESWSRRLCRLCGIGRVNEGIVAELRNLLTEYDT